MKMAELVYILCALTSLACAILLLRNYWRNRTELLLWCAICFLGLAVNNSVLFVDLVLMPTQVDLSLLRNTISAFSGLTLLFGLIWCCT